MMFNRHLARFSRLVFQTSGLPEAVLLSIVRDRAGFSARYRTAALRHLIHCAPVSITQGLPFAQRRRRVRSHYGI